MCGYGAAGMEHGVFMGRALRIGVDWGHIMGKFVLKGVIWFWMGKSGEYGVRCISGYKRKRKGG